MLTGSLVALITPMHEDGRVNYEQLETLVQWHIDNGTDAIVSMGTTGESATLSVDEHLSVVEATIQYAAKRIKIIAGTGANNTREAIELSLAAERLGADYTLSVVPYYNKPSQEGMYRHFKAIAEAAAIPMILYNVPGRTVVNMSNETILRLAQIPNIVGVKEASGSMEQVDEIIKNKPHRFDVISGDDALTFSMVASGAAGVISVIGNALPKEFSRMIRLEFNGEYEPARKIHHKFTELYSLLFIDGNPAGCKALLNDMGMIENVLRLPLVPTTITTKQKMAAILKELRI